MDNEVKVSEECSEKYDEWDCKRYAETLLEAEEIKNDPKKMAAAEKHIAKMKKDISSLDQLRAVAKEKREEEANG